MLRQVIASGTKGRVVLMDSITKMAREDEGAIVVSASHGGSSSGEFALAVPVALVIFNDAGGGKDDAGVAALTLLQSHGIPAATVAHTSARIGDAKDAWENGVISHSNEPARRLGVSNGGALRATLAQIIDPT
jgi:hypothetical protein